MKPLSIKNLWVKVNEHIIVDGFNMDVDEGEIVVLTGPIGSGKSTILKVIAGIIPTIYPNYIVRGSIEIYGMDPGEAVGKGLIAYVPQDPHMFFIGTSINEEISYLENKCINEWVKGLCSETRIDQLSSGQLYRLLLGSAICSGARILLFDEPTSYLDNYELSLFLRRLRKIVDKEDLVAIIVDHRVRILEKTVDKIVYVRKYPVKQLFSITTSTKHSIYNDPVLELCRVSIGYDKPIIKDIDLVIRSGETIVVYGRNGSGKTTLAKTIAGLLKPLNGRVIVHGRIFYIPQNPIYWFAHDTVYEELQYYSRIYGFKELDKLINLFELENILDHHPYMLSIGEARLLSLALALTTKPDLIIMDEPLIGLDPWWISRIVDLLNKVHSVSIFLLSHNSMLRSIADKYYVIKGNKLIRYE